MHAAALASQDRIGPGRAVIVEQHEVAVDIAQEGDAVPVAEARRAGWTEVSAAGCSEAGVLAGVDTPGDVGKVKWLTKAVWGPRGGWRKQSAQVSP
jgi:hypothetical protein